MEGEHALLWRMWRSVTMATVQHPPVAHHSGAIGARAQLPVAAAPPPGAVIGSSHSTLLTLVQWTAADTQMTHLWRSLQCAT